MALRTEELAKTIDQTMLGADPAPGEIEALCRQALELHLASVCVLPRDVAAAAEELRGGDVKVCAVLGFPAGGASVQAKIAEAERALAEGAGELEFVMNVGALRGGDIRLVRDELVTFVRTMRMRSANGGRGVVVLKAIMGTSDLDDKLKQLACKIIERAEVDFAQTSAGHAPAVATRRLYRSSSTRFAGSRSSSGSGTPLSMLPSSSSTPTAVKES